MSSLYIDNTNTVQLKGLQSVVDDSYINDATVTVTVYDADGDPITGESWPVTLAYVASSNGNYAGSISHAANLTEHACYTVTVTATLPDGSQFKMTDTAGALVRKVV